MKTLACKSVSKGQKGGVILFQALLILGLAQFSTFLSLTLDTSPERSEGELTNKHTNTSSHSMAAFLSESLFGASCSDLGSS